MKSINDWSMGTKLWALSGWLIMGILVQGLVGAYFTHKIGQVSSELTERNLPAVRLMTLTDMSSDAIQAEIYKSIVISGTKDVNIKDHVRADLIEHINDLYGHLKELSELGLHADDAAKIQSVASLVDQYIAEAKEILELALNDKKEAAESLVSNFEATFSKLDSELIGLTKLVEESAKENKEIALQTERNSKRIQAFLLLFGMVAGVLGALWIIRSLLHTLRGVMQRLGEQSRHLSSTSTDLQSSSQNLSSATTEQAAAIQETASSIEEMSAMVKKSSENANRSRDVATSSAQVANRGKQTVEEMLQSIGEINISNEKIMKAIETSNRQISEIVGVIREIGNKTKVINDIVFQTKLLSFNASVEAARAGEHGKGFAVVAEEVGNLAQMSGNAAKEIGDMLGGSIQKVEKIVHETKTQVERLVADGKSKVDAGSVVAKQCAEILDEMVKNVNEVKEMIGEISTAAQEQSQGVSEITKAMNQLDQATHENAGTSQEAATFSNQIKTEAEQLVHEVTILRNLVEGVQGMSVTSVAPPKPEVSKSLKVARAKTEESPSPELKTFGKDDVKEVEASVARPMASRARAVGAEDLPHENDPRFQDI